jgi:hypothetical protein
MNNCSELRFRAWRAPEVVYSLKSWQPDEAKAFVVGSDGREGVFRLLPFTRNTGSDGWRPPLSG